MTWPEIFDLLSSEYGWTTKTILETTIYEISWRIKEIIKRLNVDRNFEMALRGIKPSLVQGENNQADRKLDDDEKKAMDIALKRAKERKRLEFLNKKG